MDLDFKDKVVIVTGGAQGIGKSISEEFAKRKAKIVIFDVKEEVRKKMQEKGRKVVELKVSGGFHSPFMEPAKKDLEKVIEKLTFKQAYPPIVSNFLAKPVKEPFLIKESLLNQLTHPVLWQRCIEFMVEEGVKVFFEVGPSRVLRGLIKKINSQVKIVNIEKVKDLEGGGNGFGF